MLLGAKTCPQYCRLQKCLHCHGRSYDCSSRRSGPTVGATVKVAAFTFRCPDYRLQQYVVEHLEQKYHGREEVYGSVCCPKYTYAGKKLHSFSFRFCGSRVRLHAVRQRMQAAAAAATTTTTAAAAAATAAATTTTTKERRTHNNYLPRL